MDEIITPSEVAQLLKIHVKTVYRLAEQGAIPGNRVGRSWRFNKQSVLALVAGNPARGSKSGPPSQNSTQQ
jgi:excisionase family DNA binding protein